MRASRLARSVSMPLLGSLALTAIACGQPPGAATAPTVVAPPPGPGTAAPPPATPKPTAILRPLLMDERTAFFPDPDCHGKGAPRVLGYAPLPDAEVEATFFLVGADDVCTLATRARAKLLLSRAESAEQRDSCGAWRAQVCTAPPLSLALPSPPFREVKTFAGRIGWDALDNQSDELGQPRRPYYAQPVPGTTLALRHLRSGAVSVYAESELLGAFWAQAFVQLDGAPHLVTGDELVELAVPLKRTAFPSLHHAERPPTPRPDPLGRGEN